VVLKEILFLVDFIIDLFFAFLEKEAVCACQKYTKKTDHIFSLSSHSIFSQTLNNVLLCPCVVVLDVFDDAL